MTRAGGPIHLGPAVGRCLATALFLRAMAALHGFAAWTSQETGVRVFFGIALAAFVIWGAVGLSPLLGRGPLVSIGADGIRDRRVSRDWIPSAAVAALSVREFRGEPTHLVVRPRPGATGMPGIRLRARLARSLGRLSGADGSWVNGATLDGGFPALLAAAESWLPDAVPIWRAT